MLRLHDTLTRTDKEVRPLDGKTLRFYCCGPTVYGPAHIGNFRTFVAQDVFRRVVEASGTPTLHVRNLTDVDDKTIRDSQKAGQSLTDFTEFWTTKFHADCAALNTLAPHIEPSAVKHIPHQIAMIEKLIANGHAYAAADGSVYFRVSSFKDYGKLSHLEDRELRLGASEAASATDSDEYTKDSLTDFALWKARKPEDGPNFWPSPWGEGRPGWHLECSAMILEYLGEDFDLHSGGVDLIFPHHENEIAQSCCSTHGHFAAHWFHIAHLMVDGGKMSKSLGNLYTLEDLKARGYTASEVRYVLISGHYSAPLNFTMHSLDSARQALQKLSKTEHSLKMKALYGVKGAELGVRPPHPPAPDRAQVLAEGSPGLFEDGWLMLQNNLNVPGALGVIFSKLREADQTAIDQTTARKNLFSLLFMLEALGLQLPEPQADADTIKFDVSNLKESSAMLSYLVDPKYKLEFKAEAIDPFLQQQFSLKLPAFHVLNLKPLYQQDEVPISIRWNIPSDLFNTASTPLSAQQVASLSALRFDAKAAKDWATADALRKQLDAAGWLIKDSKEGFTVVPK